MDKRMRVSVVLEFDAEAWGQEYGLAPNEVRQDFVNWLASTLAYAEVPIAVFRK
jgi:hypothetical protein